MIDTKLDGGVLSSSIGNETVTVIEREYNAYRFELFDGKMVSVSNDVFTKNSLSKYSSSNVYSFDEDIILKHEKTR